MEGDPYGLALPQDGRVDVQPIHVPVIRVLARLESHGLPVESDVTGRAVGIGDGHQVEPTAVHRGRQVQLAVFVEGVEEVLPVDCV